MEIKSSAEVIEDLKKKLSKQNKLVADLQRSRERWGKHVIGMTEANLRRQGEVQRLEKKLMAIYRVIREEGVTPEAKLEVVNKILDRSVPLRIKAYEERRASS